MLAHSSGHIEQGNSEDLDSSKVDWRIYFSALLIPLAILDVRYDIGGMIVRFSDLYLLAMFSAFSIFGGPGFTKKTLGHFLIYIPFIFYAASFLFLNDLRSGLKQILQWFLVLLWPLCLCYSLRRTDLTFIRALRLFLFLCAATVVFMHINTGYIIGYKHEGDMKYVFGIFFLVALMCVKCLPGKISWFYLLVATIFLAASLERKGIVVGVLASVVFLVLCGSPKFRRAFPGLAAIAIVSCILSGVMTFEIAIKNNPIYSYALDEAEAVWHSNLHRMNLIGNGVEIFYDNLWFGVGADQLVPHMAKFYVMKELAFYTHNWYLDFLVEYGILGAALFFAVPLFLLARIKIKDGIDCIYASLSIYCFIVPVFMANGTTSMLIWLTSVGLFFQLFSRSREV